MTIVNKWIGVAFIAVTIVATSDFSVAGTATPDSIIVMPARKRVVQLAFQMARCKKIGLVTYNTSPTLSEPLIHVWNGQEWLQITLQDYTQGSFMSGDPKHVFLLGDSTTIPLRMMDEVSWYKDLHRLTTLDTTALINEIGTALKFSSHQWKFLANENGLKIEDRNAERRRFGRWGSPGKEVDLKPVKLETIEMPPAPIIEPVAEKSAPVVEKPAPVVEKPAPVVTAPAVTKPKVVEAKPVVEVKPTVETKTPVAPEKVIVPEKPVVTEPSAGPVTTTMEDDKDDPAEK
ncbi:MAG: hypothetical protein WCL49_06210 [bacterium]